MKKELVNGFVSKLEANMESIEKVINENLGLNLKLRVVTSGRENINVSVEEFENDDSTRVLTSHPLLRQMFKEAMVWAQCWYFEDKNQATFNVHISYDHNFRGGSNGTDLMMFDMDLTTGEVTAIKK